MIWIDDGKSEEDNNKHGEVKQDISGARLRDSLHYCSV